MTSPVMWLLSLITVFPAIVLRENTLALIALFIYFAVVYVYIYKRIIRFASKTKISDTVNNNINKKTII
jgi:hypothetical protein